MTLNLALQDHVHILFFMVYFACVHIKISCLQTTVSDITFTFTLKVKVTFCSVIHYVSVHIKINSL